MSRKSYLSQQIKLVSLASYDLFTDQEMQLYLRLVEISKFLRKRKKDKDIEGLTDLVAQRQETQNALNEEIQKHSGTPRKVRLKNVLEKTAQEQRGITWDTLKVSRRITEFSSEESRALGLKDKDITLDKIVLKWKSLDVLEQIVLDGFIVPILMEDGSIIEKHYNVVTASAGQLRTDKVQCLSDDAWNKIKDRLECGMDWDTINAKGGINQTKYMAYLALASSATEEWDVDIDKIIVIDDFEAPVTGLVQYIKPDYTYEIGVKTVMINHCDGIGMMLPSVSDRNFMVRAPFVKGLLTVFDFIKFCQVNNVDPIIEDVYGIKHDLIAEDIQIILTKSQFKLWKYYDSFEDYKKIFKKNGCKFCRTNFEEDFIEDKQINYQMLQTLTDFTDDEVETFVSKAKYKIEGLSRNKEEMLKALNASPASDNPYEVALYLYNELLRDAYTKSTVKAIQRRWLLDAKSGAIKCKNKRLFAIPDMYAACQFWFMHEKEPEGLLKDGEIACRVYRKYDKACCLRSPHLYMEWTVREIVQKENIYEWFKTNGVYTSCHDLISRVLQFDVDGDQLNVVVEPLLIKIAERNLKEFNVIPLFYDANKADPEMLSRESLFSGIKRAHDYSGIGQVSNSLTKLWNKDTPDREAAALLCFFNNLIIDAAKTGRINSYEDHPSIAKKISKAIGGKASRMPYFFQFSKNGRRYLNVPTDQKKSYSRINQSTMNRICKQFQNDYRLDFAGMNISPFNWQMLISNTMASSLNRTEEQIKKDEEVINLFCELDSDSVSSVLSSEMINDVSEVVKRSTYEILSEKIANNLEAIMPLREAYIPIVRYLFEQEGINKAKHKQMFWRIFGEFVVEALRDTTTSYMQCDKCGKKVPAWAIFDGHSCKSKVSTEIGFLECRDCGAIVERLNSKQTRCLSCQAQKRKTDRRTHRERSCIISWPSSPIKT